MSQKFEVDDKGMMPWRINDHRPWRVSSLNKVVLAPPMLSPREVLLMVTSEDELYY